MKKYLTIIKTELQRQFTYRYDIASYVPGNFFELFFAYLLWTIIYQSSDVIRGYTYAEMVTYIIIGWIFAFLTSTYEFEYKVSREIHLGTLTNYLLKPISYLKFISVTAVGRVLIAMGFIIFQGAIYILLFGDKMILNVSIEKMLIMFVMMILAFIINLFLALLVGMMSFWLTEISGFHAFTAAVIKFFSGGYFPLALLPITVLKIAYFLPFAYTIFVPVQYFMDKISLEQALQGIMVQMVWCLLLYLLIKIVWKFGLKKYEGYGI